MALRMVSAETLNGQTQLLLKEIPRGTGPLVDEGVPVAIDSTTDRPVPGRAAAAAWAAKRIELVEDWPVEKWIRYDQENTERRKSIR